jgi:type III secretion system FlhB-like substrate exporter
MSKRHQGKKEEILLQYNFPGTPASSITKTGRHDIAEILLKVALNTKNQSKHVKENDM